MTRTAHGRWRLVVAATVTSLSLSNSPALANPPVKGGSKPAASASAKAGAPGDAESKRRRAAAEHGDKAMKLFGEGKLEQAREQADKARELHDQPQYALYAARTRAETGKLLEAKLIYTEITKVKDVDGTSATYKKALELAPKELTALNARIPHLRLSHKSKGRPGSVKVSIDGASADTLNANTSLDKELDPGPHRVRVTQLKAPAGAAGGKEVEEVVVELSVALAEKESNSLDLTLHLSSAESGCAKDCPVVVPTSTTVPVDTAVPCAPPGPFPEPSPAPKTVHWMWKAGAFGVGVLGVGVGAGAGVVALGMSGDLKAACTGLKCSGDESRFLDSTKAAADLSTAGFVLGAAALGLGVTLHIVDLTRTGPARVGVAAGPNGVVIKGEM